MEISAVGTYIDNSATTSAVKIRFVDNKSVDAAATIVEKLKGTVMVSGFAKNTTDRTTAKALTWKVDGVKAVKNEIAVRP